MRLTIGLLWVGVLMTGCSTNRANGPAAEPDSVFDDHTAAVSPDAPSVTGTDRSDWSVLRVAAVDGTLYHRPTYLTQEWLLRADRPSPLYRDDPGNEKSLRAALDDDRAKAWQELLQMGISPVEFAVGMIWWPARAVVVEQPWDISHSP